MWTVTKNPDHTYYSVETPLGEFLISNDTNSDTYRIYTPQDVKVIKGTIEDAKQKVYEILRGEAEEIISLVNYLTYTDNVGN